MYCCDAANSRPICSLTAAGNLLTAALYPRKPERRLVTASPCRYCPDGQAHTVRVRAGLVRGRRRSEPVSRRRRMRRGRRRPAVERKELTRMKKYALFLLVGAFAALLALLVGRLA